MEQYCFVATGGSPQQLAAAVGYVDLQRRPFQRDPWGRIAKLEDLSGQLRKVADLNAPVVSQGTQDAEGDGVSGGERCCTTSAVLHGGQHALPVPESFL
jgi:hypothetical protein